MVRRAGGVLPHLPVAPARSRLKTVQQTHSALQCRHLPLHPETRQPYSLPKASHRANVTSSNIGRELYADTRRASVTVSKSGSTTSGSVGEAMQGGMQQGPCPAKQRRRQCRRRRLRLRLGPALGRDPSHYRSRLCVHASKRLERLCGWRWAPKRRTAWPERTVPFGRSRADLQ